MNDCKNVDDKILSYLASRLVKHNIALIPREGVISPRIIVVYADIFNGRNGISMTTINIIDHYFFLHTTIAILRPHNTARMIRYSKTHNFNEALRINLADPDCVDVVEKIVVQYSRLNKRCKRKR